jgi:hypothetical protein
MENKDVSLVSMGILGMMAVVSGWAFSTYAVAPLNVILGVVFGLMACWLFLLVVLLWKERL